MKMERAKNLLKRFRSSLRAAVPDEPDTWTGDQYPLRVHLEEVPLPHLRPRVDVSPLPEIVFSDMMKQPKKWRIPGLAKVKGIMAWVVLLGNIAMTFVTYGDSFPLYLFFAASSLIVLDYIWKFRKPTARWPWRRKVLKDEK